MSIETGAAHHGAAPALRALTVRRPWAALIASGIKTVENRSRLTRHRGLLAIHAGGVFEARQARNTADAAGYEPSDDWWEETAHPTGVVAIASIAEVCSGSIASVRRNACRCGPWAIPGKYHWQLTGIVALPAPIPIDGALGLWRLPPDIDTRVRAQLEVAS